MRPDEPTFYNADYKALYYVLSRIADALENMDKPEPVKTARKPRSVAPDLTNE